MVELLSHYDLEHKLPEVKAWYDGYLVGNTPGIFNPWSVLKYIKENGSLKSYWVNTSDNSLMKQLLTRGGEEVKRQLEALMRGESLAQDIEDGVVFAYLEDNAGLIWTLLL